MKIEQGSPEWHKLRATRMTASHAQAISANGKGLKTYIRDKMCKLYSTSEDVSYSNANMEYGLEQESVAVMLYEFETGNKTTKIGFEIYNDYVGASPDRLVEKDGLVEIKCPTDKVYFNLLLDKKIDSKYYAQMQMQMLVCDKDWCDYAVYNPNFKQQLFIKRVERDEDFIEKLKLGFESGTKMIKEIKEELKNE
ncbi:MAG: YqaJ viral recombinase family protein [Nanoarchaeota archaeon]|nr:YqaJ viral recombinase family protein [Nanoarchaeota archaeon]